MDGDSESCPIAGFSISGVKHLDCTTRQVAKYCEVKEITLEKPKDTEFVRAKLNRGPWENV
jgi:hypothetical protein